MLTIKGIYDGKTITPLEKIKSKKRFKVIITFVEEIAVDEENNNLRHFSAQTSGLDFWNDTKEDIYQDYLVKNR